METRQRYQLHAILDDENTTYSKGKKSIQHKPYYYLHAAVLLLKIMVLN